MSKENKHFYEFGPFRVDPEQRVLLCDNQPVPLQPKAFDTLLVLIQHSQEVVLKDDLMKSLWPDSFVEESNLSQNIFVLRKALGEKGGDHRYIVTMPGRGYRFAEKVRVISEGETFVAESHSRSKILVEEEVVRDVADLERPKRHTKPSELQLPTALSKTASRPTLILEILIAAAAALTLAAVGYLYFRRTPGLTDKDTVVLADFANATGDPVFDGSLRQGLSAQLEQSPFLSLLSDHRIARTLSLMAQPKDARLTHDLAREVCQRTASAAVLDGTIAQIGARYLLTLRALKCANGEPLASATAEASDKNHVLEALGKVASEMRSKLGESLNSVQKYDVPAPEVTTPSLEALKSYSLAMHARNANSDLPTIQLFQRAIDQDSNFAMAHAQLGVHYFNLGQTVRGADHIQRAYELKDRVSDREKLYIASHYDYLVKGDIEAARKDYELWAQVYPRDQTAPAMLGVLYLHLGDYDKVLTMTKKAEDLLGPNKISANLVWSYILVNRFGEAKAIALEAQTRKEDDPTYHLSLYMIDFLQQDFAGTKREAAGLLSSPTWGHAALDYEADTAAYGGQFAKAREFTHRAADSAQKADNEQSAASYQADAAIREALVGNTGLAKQGVKSALALLNAKDVEAMSAIASSLAGDSAQTMQLINDLGKRFPQDTIVQFNYLLTIRAAAELRNGDPGKAIGTLVAAAPYELGTTALASGISLYPVYMRGEAYLAAKQGPAAAAEFQKILDHPGVVQNQLIGALAHLGLGRALALSGDISRAKAAYQDFLSLWKDADPDIPILKQAKAEYVKFQKGTLP
jgi:DNA-binding winged helix-turn-helix (wHTH) protein/tetratricopeptide (TPR) repeat protein